MTKLWRKKVVLAKVEGSYGQDAAPGAANAIQAVNVSLSPMQGKDIDRELDTPYFGATGTLAADLHQTISFKVELAGSGVAGTPPGWSALMQACATAEVITANTSAAYNPISDQPSSVTIYLNIDGTLYKLPGSRGTATFEIAASGIPYINFEFTGLYARPADVAAVTPDFSAFRTPRVASNANTPVFTLGGSSFVLRSFSMAMGNEIEPQFLIGEEEILIADSENTIQAQVRATALSTLNPFQIAEDRGTLALVIEHGTTAGDIITLNVPNAQMQRPEGLENGQGRKEWPLRLVPLPTAGNDQWTLTLT